MSCKKPTDQTSDQLSTGNPSEADEICTSDDDKSIKGLSITARKGRAIVSFDLENEMCNVLQNLGDPANKKILDLLKNKPRTAEERRLHKLERKKKWYAENRELIREKARIQYHNDIEKWQQIRDHAKEQYRKKREGIEPLKRGRKPKEIDPNAPPPPPPRPRGRPANIKKNDAEIVQKNPVGRPRTIHI